jgi:hypothetical protein
VVSLNKQGAFRNQCNIVVYGECRIELLATLHGRWRHLDRTTNQPTRGKRRRNSRVAPEFPQNRTRNANLISLSVRRVCHRALCSPSPQVVVAFGSATSPPWPPTLLIAIEQEESTSRRPPDYIRSSSPMRNPGAHPNNIRPRLFLCTAAISCGTIILMNIAKHVSELIYGQVSNPSSGVVGRILKVTEAPFTRAVAASSPPVCAPPWSSDAVTMATRTGAGPTGAADRLKSGRIDERFATMWIEGRLR